MAEVLSTIAGREMSPAESVFKNVQLPGLKPMRAGQFVRAMNQGYARSLGVSCVHCHVTSDWASDDKAPKVIARSMIRMTNQLTQQIRAFPAVSQTATVTCTTCHRGVVKPATSLPPPDAR
jgi:cytochrome c553